MPWLPLLLACTGPSNTDSGPVSACPDDSLAPGEVQVLATGFEHGDTVGTEGVVFSPDGRLFVGGSAALGSGFIAEVFTDGSWTMLTPLAATVGLAWWNGRIVAATSGGGAAGDSGGIVLVDPDSGETEILTSEVPGSNFPVLTPWDTLLVSSPGGTDIWEVTADGTTTHWLGDLVSPNGLVFDESGEFLYVAQTYWDPNVFRRVEIRSDHTPGTVEALATLPSGSTQDGVALDADGNVHVILNLPGQIVTITPQGDDEITAYGLDYGASLAFGTGDWDPCSLVVTSLFSDQLFIAGAGVPGATGSGR
jgi:hypothetical protein